MKKRETRILSALCFAAGIASLSVAFGVAKSPIPVLADSTKTIMVITSGSQTSTHEFDDAASGWIAAALRANSTDEVKLIIGNDWEHDNQLTIGEGKRLTLDLNGHYIKRTRNKKQISDGSVFLVKKDATFTVMDSNPEEMGYDGNKGGVIVGGSSGNGAGGIHIEEKGHVVWTGGTLYECDTDEHGGGFYLEGSSYDTSLTMTGGKIYACQTIDSADNCHGGAIYVNRGTVNIRNTTFDDCYSEDYGGAIYINDGYMNVYDSVFSANKANDYGGAVYLAGDALIHFENCIFAGNQAGDDGGAVHINNNPSKEKAEGFENLDSPATIFNNCVFRNNKSETRGGALHIDDDNVALIDVTIENNQAKTGGGGVWVDSQSDITVKGKCIIKDNRCANESGFNNVTLQRYGASKAYIYSAGLYHGSWIGVNSDSSDDDILICPNMSKYQMQYFHADKGKLVMRDEEEVEAPMVVTASLFGNGLFWAAIGVGGALLGVGIFVIVRRKKIKAKAATEGEEEE